MKQFMKNAIIVFCTAAVVLAGALVKGGVIVQDALTAVETIR